MSTERATLSDFATTRSVEERRQDRIDEYRDIILQEGGIYGRDTDTATTESQPTGMCLTCQREIDPQVARVVGDNNDNVEVCHQCWASVDGQRYKSVATAMNNYRDGDGDWVDDVEGDA